MKHAYKILLSTALFGALAACQNSSIDEAPAPIAEAPTTETTLAAAEKTTAIETGQLSSAEAAAVEKLMWIKSANAEVDAKAALLAPKDGKVKLYTYSSRGDFYPGLNAEQVAQIKSRVMKEHAPGMGDVLHGQTHKALSREVRDYVKDYNMRVYTALMQ